MRIHPTQVPVCAERYPDRVKDQTVISRAARIRTRGFLDLDDLSKVCFWKSPRSAGRARKNEDDVVREISRCSLGALCEVSRIESLQILHGVDYPTASVILRLHHRDDYPILDFRAIWSLGLSKPSYHQFTYWQEFCAIWRKALAECRREQADLSARDFDRALWQFSKENQKTGQP